MKRIISIILAAVMIFSVSGAGAFAAESAVKFGDINLDSKINSSDALLALRISTGTLNADSTALKAGDVDKNGRVNSSDALLILQFAVGLLKAFPAGVSFEAEETPAMTTLKASVVDPVISTKVFTLKADIIADDMEVPTTLAVKDNDLSITMSMMGFDVRIFSADGKYYMALPTLGYYDEINKSNFDSLTLTADLLNHETTYVETTKVTDGAVTYTCEQYEDSDGTVYKYYFTDKNVWKRWEIVNGDSITFIKIVSLKEGASDTLFKISKFWKKDPQFSAVFNNISG